MDHNTAEKREKLFNLAFSSTHDGEILNAVRKLKDLGVISLPSTSPKHQISEKQVSDLIYANSSLRMAVKDRDRLIGKLEDQISDLNTNKRDNEKKISSLESHTFFLKCIFYVCIFVISGSIIFRGFYDTASMD